MQTALMNIDGMSYGGGASKITNGLKVVSGVGRVNVSRSAREASMQLDGQLTSPRQLKAAMKSAG